MRIEWEVTDDDVSLIKDLIARQAENWLVGERRVNNCAKVKPQVDRRRFWHQMVSMRLTSLQRSGRNSPVWQFERLNPFPLAYEAVRDAGSREQFISERLHEAHLDRFREAIPKQLARNFDCLENEGEWERALAECNQLTILVARTAEVEVAEYIRNKFLGFGPKQSRNLLQALGLTRFEIPIDSRMTGWLNDFGFPIQLSAEALSDINYYNFVSDGIEKLCAASGELPCIFDAAVFAEREPAGSED